jgi:hypothetical protein
MTFWVNNISEQLIAILTINVTTIPRECFRETRIIIMNGGEMIS